MADRPAGFLLEEASLEDSDDAFREIDELMEDCRNRLTFHNSVDIRERYAEGNLQIVLKLGLRGEGGEVYAFLQRAEGFSAQLERVIARKCTLNSAEIGGVEEDRLVFVTHVEFGQEVKQVIPSTVRFEAVDEFSSSRGDLLYFLRAPAS